MFRDKLEEHNSIIEIFNDINKKNKVRSDSLIAYLMFYDHSLLTTIVNFSFEGKSMFLKIIEMFGKIISTNFTFFNIFEMIKLKLGKQTYFKFVDSFTKSGYLSQMSVNQQFDLIKFILSDVYKNLLSKNEGKFQKEKSDERLQGKASSDKVSEYQTQEWGKSESNSKVN